MAKLDNPAHQFSPLAWRRVEAAGSRKLWLSGTPSIHTHSPRTPQWRANAPWGPGACGYRRREGRRVRITPLATLPWSRIALEPGTPSIHTHSPRTPQARKRAVGVWGVWV